MRLFQPRCSLCRSERVSIALEPIAKRYDLRSLWCPNCEFVLQMVEPCKDPCCADVRRRTARGKKTYTLQ